MTGGLPSEAGVERSILQWLDGLGWETHGKDGGRGANILDETYDRRSNEVIYWDLLAERVVAINDEITGPTSDASRTRSAATSTTTT